MRESNRRFLVKWFDSFVWLEYSKEKDAAFCLHCYLFKCDFDKQGKAGSDVFTEKGFKNWRKGPENFRDHVGQVGSLHNKATQHCTDLMNQKQHVETIVIKQTDQARINYRILLTAALDCTRYLLRQGLPFRGHDESETSSNKGNYVELLQFLANHDEKVRAVVFENAPKNLKYIAPTIQKDLINSCAAETIDLIISDMDDAFFSILVDESRDVSIREQMAVVLRYVNKKGQVIERFVGVQYVSDTTSSKLKEAIEQLISSTNLSMSRLRGQGYDGASNMRGELNGLKTQILREYPQAYYVHCFAHQLQLALVAVAKGNENIATFFTTASSVVNIIGASCKRRDALREQQQKDIMETLEIDDLETGRGLNQETTLKRPCDTRWNSHYDTLLSINIMFHPVVKVLEWIVDDVNQDNLGEANRLLKEIQTFDFVFHLYLMRFILGITNDLSKALQKKDQDIVNAMMLVQRCKQKLQSVRDDDFDDLLREVSIFCGKNDIDVPNMDDLFVPQGRSRRKAQKITNRQYYRVDLFLTIIDKQLVELNNRFTEEPASIETHLPGNDDFVPCSDAVVPPTTSSQNPTPSPLEPSTEKRKPCKKESDVWEHFEKYDLVLDLKGVDGTKRKEVEKRAKCKYCSATYASDTKKNGTSNMWKHLNKQCLQYPYRHKDKNTRTLAFDASKGNALVSRNLTKMIVWMLVLGWWFEMSYLLALWRVKGLGNFVVLHAHNLIHPLVELLEEDF
ncbi:zinc finger MYM-type protein 1-like [Prunus dulcis]|uniref:zinc finger MYM-type protein 1-like n=1 Tax=Prunus dulcis TaxID=3755 RepID=UPI0014834CD2|nr:zinc finger MYM-type protein 1-like [Prunus dulcis]